MGYTTDFDGNLTIEPPLNADQVAYINQFSETRRVKRDETITETLPDPLRIAVGLPVGKDGGYYVGGSGFRGSNHKQPGIVSYNQAPIEQPGLWCQWVVSDSGDSLEWDGGEKFYKYVSWLEYLIEHFFTPWGVKLNGQIRWQGESPDDRGVIHVRDSVVCDVPDEIVSPEPSFD